MDKWREVSTLDGQTYYHNIDTNETVWDLPDERTEISTKDAENPGYFTEADGFLWQLDINGFFAQRRAIVDEDGIVPAHQMSKLEVRHCQFLKIDG